MTNLRVGPCRSGHASARRIRGGTRLGARLVLLAALVGLPSLAWAGDYDRNLVAGRELGLYVQRTAVSGGPVSFLLRGTARRHVRYFYLGTELQLGATSRPGLYFSGGLAAGLETADTAYRPVRGYVEMGVSGQWTHSTLFEAFVFHTETGVRVLLQSNVRPHMYFHIGLRASTNFSTYGVGVATGVGWTFD